MARSPYLALVIILDPAIVPMPRNWKCVSETKR